MTDFARDISLRDVQIVLATYNGAPYLEQQLQSILGQLGEGELLIHDDGSTDGTPALLRDWASRDSRIRVLDGPPQGGASANFSYLLEQSAAPYVFCADQDDVWEPDKLRRMLTQMRFYEGVYGQEWPLLVHSDLSLTGPQGDVIAPSMWAYQSIDPRWGDRFNLLLTQNVVTGCAMLVNRALLDRALPVPREATMHDHWLALVACGQGKVVWMEEPTVLYRQHGNNEVGARKYSAGLMWSRLASLLAQTDLAQTDRSREVSAENKMYATAECYARRFPQRPETVQARAFAALKDGPLLLRPVAVVRGRFLMKGGLRSLAWAVKPSRYIATARQTLQKLSCWRGPAR